MRAFIWLLFVGIVFSCRPLSQELPPFVSTNDASEITATSAKANGSLQLIGSGDLTAFGHCYSTSNQLPTVSDEKIEQTSTLFAGNPFSTNLPTLLPNTTYYVRAYATSTIGTGYGETRTFKTAPFSPAAVVTGTATQFTAREATMQGRLTEPGNSAITQYGHCWSASNTSPSITDTRTILTTAITAGQMFTSQLSSLTPNTVYNVRAYATNAAGTVYGEAYTFKTNVLLSWLALPDFTSSNYADAVSFVLNGRGYFTTGLTSITPPPNGSRSRNTWEFNPATNTWAPKVAYPGDLLTNAIAFVINGKAYVTLGRSSNPVTPYPVTMFAYDPVANSWSQAASFPGVGREGASVAVTDGKAYVTMGMNITTSPATYFRDCYEYNPTTNIWRRVADFSGAARANGTGFGIESGVLFGTGASATTAFSDFWEYNPAANTWTTKPALPANPERNFTEGISLNGKGYVGFGQAANGTGLRDVYEYNPATGAWRTLGAFTGQARINEVMFGIGDKIYYGMGRSGSTVLRDFWQFNY